MDVNASALGHFKPSLSIVRIPACPACGGANPQGLAHCPDCGRTAPEKTDHAEVADNVIPVRRQNVPFTAWVCLWLGAKLRNLARRLEG